MLYCTKCRTITKTDCPICGRNAEKLSEVHPEDMVYLVNGRLLQASMIEPLLADTGIPVYRDGALGAALSMHIGSAFELYNLFVPYAEYQRAYELVAGVFADDPDILSRLQKYDITDETR